MSNNETPVEDGTVGGGTAEEGTGKEKTTPEAGSEKKPQTQAAENAASSKPKDKGSAKRKVIAVVVGIVLFVGGGGIGYAIGSSTASHGPQGGPPEMQQGQRGPGGNGQQPPSDGQKPPSDGGGQQDGNGGQQGSDSGSSSSDSTATS